MNDNPYSAPGSLESQSDAEFQDPATRIRGPATALIVVSSIAIVLFAISWCLSALLLYSGTAAQLPQRNRFFDHETAVMIRMGWGLLVIVVNIVILVAAVNMLKLKGYRLAHIGAALAVVPCVGPCYILGIPFGIWALRVLNEPEVKKAFRS